MPGAKTKMSETKMTLNIKNNMIFVHGGFFHLFINMFVLFSMGGLCERIIGRKRFFWFYLITKVFFFDIDNYIISKYFPTAEWLIQYKFFIFKYDFQNQLFL